MFYYLIKYINKVLICGFLLASISATLALLGNAAKPQEATLSQPSQPPFSPWDQQLDELGAQISSEDQAGLYLRALLKRHDITESILSNLVHLRNRVARAEYQALGDPNLMIPESKVAAAFNWLMHEAGMPDWTKITEDEFHAFRTVMSQLVYPKTAPRTHHGNLAPLCRPVEAVRLIILLQSSRGVQPEIREAIRSGQWPEDPITLTIGAQGKRELRPLMPGHSRGRREFEYRQARAKYFERASRGELETLVEKLLEKLEIP